MCVTVLSGWSFYGLTFLLICVGYSIRYRKIRFIVVGLQIFIHLWKIVQKSREIHIMGENTKLKIALTRELEQKLWQNMAESTNLIIRFSSNLISRLRSDLTFR